MKRFVVRLSLSVISGLALLIGFAATATPAAAASVWYVDDDGAQCKTPYTTISGAVAAISALPTWGLATPKVIIVCAGTYPESSVWISGARNLRLVAKPGVVVTPNTSPYANFLFHVIDSTNVSITNFTIDGLDALGEVGPHEDNSYAITYYSSSGLIAKNKIVRWRRSYASVNDQVIGIGNFSGEAVRIDHNVISDFMGVAINASGSNLTVTRNVIDGSSMLGDAIMGVLLTDATNGTISGNRITSDAYPKAGPGSFAITLAGTTNVRVTSNTISHYDTGIRLDAECTNVDYSQVTGNRLLDVFTGVYVHVDGSSYCVTSPAHADKNVIVKNTFVIDDTVLGNFGVQMVAGPALSTAAGNEVRYNTFKHYTPGQEVYEDLTTGGSYSGTITAPNHIIP